MCVCVCVCVCVSVYCSIHNRFQEIDQDQRELSSVFPLDVRVPHEKILNIPEFRVMSQDVCL